MKTKCYRANIVCFAGNSVVACSCPLWTMYDVQILAWLVTVSRA